MNAKQPQASVESGAPNNFISINHKHFIAEPYSRGVAWAVFYRGSLEISDLDLAQLRSRSPQPSEAFGTYVARTTKPMVVRTNTKKIHRLATIQPSPPYFRIPRVVCDVASHQDHEHYGGEFWLQEK